MIETSVHQFLIADATIQAAFGGITPRVYVGAVPTGTIQPCASIIEISQNNPMQHNCITYRVQISTHGKTKFEAESGAVVIRTLLHRLHDKIGTPSVNVANCWIDGNNSFIVDNGWVNITDYMILTRS